VSSRTLAAFDFDGTMTRRDTLVPFLVSVAGRRSVSVALASESAPLARAAIGRGDRDSAKERVLQRVLGGCSYSEITAAGRAFGAAVARSGVTSAARDRISWHRREGHEVVIVSASLDVYLDEVARALGVEHVLSSRLEVDPELICTGRLVGGNCRGAEKAKRLQALCGDDDVHLWAYGNSRGDDKMLALADHPVRVRRGRMVPFSGAPRNDR